MRPFPTSAQVRHKLAEMASAHGVTLGKLSRQMGRYPAYLPRFVKLGRPEWLDPVDRDYLAAWFNVDGFELGDRDKAKPDR